MEIWDQGVSRVECWWEPLSRLLTADIYLTLSGSYISWKQFENSFFSYVCTSQLYTWELWKLSRVCTVGMVNAHTALESISHLTNGYPSSNKEGITVFWLPWHQRQFRSCVWECLKYYRPFPNLFKGLERICTSFLLQHCRVLSQVVPVSPLMNSLWSREVVQVWKLCECSTFSLIWMITLQFLISQSFFVM